MSRSLILVVDHARENVLVNESVLRRREKIVSTALSGAEALRRIESERPGLVIFGFELSDMTAPEFCRSVRETPATRATSLLFVGDCDCEENATLCIAAGCNDFILRPYLCRDLDAIVQKLTAIAVRRDLRTLVKIHVSVRTAGRAILGHTINISSSGLLVQTGEVLPPDAHVRVQFYLSGDPLPIDADSEVVRAEFVGGPPRYGLKYLNLANFDRKRLEHFVARLRSRELH
jgi:CheY-like chemotaxis protein